MEALMLCRGKFLANPQILLEKKPATVRKEALIGDSSLDNKQNLRSNYLSFPMCEWIHRKNIREIANY